MLIYEVYIFSEKHENSRKEFWDTKYESLYDQCNKIFKNEPDKIKIYVYDKENNRYDYYPEIF